MKFTLFLFVFLLTFVCSNGQNPHVWVLGTAQDGGYPQIGCKNICCSAAWQYDSLRRYVTSIAIADPATKQWWLVEATPDIKDQIQLFHRLTQYEYNTLPSGIFITHAHMGHYTGLMQFGREALSAKQVPIYVLPGMKKYLEANGPWSQLVQLNNIRLHELAVNEEKIIETRLKVTTLSVPHRDEFSETAGFIFSVADKKYLFIPDIDKWEKWNMNIIDVVKKVDIAFLDATFFSATELPNRDIREIPHPMVQETMEFFSKQPKAIQEKIRFIHLNHTNPLIWNSIDKQNFPKSGFRLAQQAERY